MLWSLISIVLLFTIIYLMYNKKPDFNTIPMKSYKKKMFIRKVLYSIAVIPIIFLSIGVIASNLSPSDKTHSTEAFSGNSSTSNSTKDQAPSAMPNTLEFDEFMRELKNAPGVITAFTEGATLWVQVPGSSEFQIRGQEFAEMILSWYVKSGGKGICVRVFYGERNTLGRACNSFQ